MQAAVTTSTVDPAMENMLNTSSQCLLEAMDFKLQYMPATNNGNAVCDYLNTAAPAHAGLTTDCSSAQSHECCSTDRHTDHMTRTFSNNGAGGFSATETYEVGTDIFDESTSSNLIAEDMNEDGRADLIIGNRLYLSDGSGSFANAKPNTIGSSTFKKAYAIDFDRQNYKDIAYLDEAGKAYIMRSSNAYSTPDTTFTFEAKYIIEGNFQSPQPFSCVVRKHQNANFEPNECSQIYEGMPLTVLSGDDSSSSCTVDYLKTLTLKVRSFSSYDCSYTTGSGTNAMLQEKCYTFYVWLPAFDPLATTNSGYTCPGTNTNDYKTLADWRDITFQGITQTPSGQTPTYYYPQRIGDVDDVGITDMAIGSFTYAGQPEDYTLDVCLLKKGRGIKCFAFGTEQNQIYDSGTAKAVFNPAIGETFDDAIEFASIRGSNNYSVINCADNNEYGLSSEIVGHLLHCYPTTPHGLDYSSRVTVTSISGYDRPECTRSEDGGAYNDNNCDWREGGVVDIMRSSNLMPHYLYKSSIFKILLPFRSTSSRNVNPVRITMRVDSKPQVLKAGFIETGRNYDSSPQMIVLRENHVPSIVQGRGNSGAFVHQFGTSIAGHPITAAYALSGFASDGLGDHGFGALAVGNSGAVDELWYTNTQDSQSTHSEDNLKVTFGGSVDTNALAWCNLVPGRNSRQVELVTAGFGQWTIKYSFTNVASVNSGSILDGGSTVAPYVATTTVLPKTTAVACADFDGDGDDDVVTHVVTRAGGSCAFRCHEIGRFGFEEYSIGQSSSLSDVKSKCYCGPLLSLAVGPSPPPTPPPQPKPPPPPPSSPPPGVPPSPSAPPLLHQSTDQGSVYAFTLRALPRRLHLLRRRASEEARCLPLRHLRLHLRFHRQIHLLRLQHHPHCLPRFHRALRLLVRHLRFQALQIHRHLLQRFLRLEKT